ncbi:MAG: PEGA domain-containing protein [Deltaproteobacteria bacterium]|nr:PEGA domain-containing protein [Deltaproteobacteria bacterium]
MKNDFPKLVVLSGGTEAGQEIVLKGRERVSIGRSDDNDFILADTSVSRRHSALIFKDNVWMIGDESSRNGTLLNDESVEVDHPVPVANLDVIRIGMYELRFVEKESSPSEIREKTSYKKLTPKEQDEVAAIENKDATEEQQREAADKAAEGATDLEESSGAETDKEELIELERKGYPPENQRLMAKGLLIFSIIAVLFCGLGVGLYFTYGHYAEKKVDDQAQTTDVQKNTGVKETVFFDILRGAKRFVMDKLRVLQGKKNQQDVKTGGVTGAGDGTKGAGVAALQTGGDAVKGQTQTGLKGQTEDGGDQATDTVTPNDDFTVTSLSTEDKAKIDSQKALDFSVFLDVETTPLAATVYFQDERLGMTPFKRNVSVKPNQIYPLYVDFELREINDVFRKKIEFKARPDTDVIELKLDAEIGVLRILKLPRRVDFYLEGFYDYDKFKANPVKISDIVYGRPVYLPYGTYTVELREKTTIAGSENLITQIRFQREYTINKENRTLNFSVSDRDLQFFPAVINSSPENAEVYFGTEKIGTTPYTGNLALGKNQIKIVKEGFFPAVIDVDMRMHSVYDVNVTLKTSKMGELVNKAKEYLRYEQTNNAVVTLVDALKYGGSAKEKAEVYYLLGETYLGLKEYNQALPYFEKAKGHEDFKHLATLGMARAYNAVGQQAYALKTVVEVLVTMNQNTTARVRSEADSVFKLVSPVKSVMYLYTDPPGAAVYINEKKIDQDTPLFLSDLGLGNYRLQFERPGYKTYKTKQNLKIGEFVLVKVRMEKED